MKAKKKIIKKFIVPDLSLYHQYSSFVPIKGNIREMKDILSQRLLGIDYLLNRVGCDDIVESQEIYQRFSDQSWEPDPAQVWINLKQEYTSNLSYEELAKIFIFLKRYPLEARTSVYLKKKFKLHENF